MNASIALACREQNEHSFRLSWSLTLVLSLVFLSRRSDDQWHQCRHEHWDRPSQELPESGGHHWQIQGGHLLLRQGNFMHRHALSEDVLGCGGSVLFSRSSHVHKTTIKKQYYCEMLFLFKWTDFYVNIL